jgi:hypothetical protein
MIQDILMCNLIVMDFGLTIRLLLKIERLKTPQLCNETMKSTAPNQRSGVWCFILCKLMIHKKCFKAASKYFETPKAVLQSEYLCF